MIPDMYDQFVLYIISAILAFVTLVASARMGMTAVGRGSQKRDKR